MWVGINAKELIASLYLIIAISHSDSIFLWVITIFGFSSQKILNLNAGLPLVLLPYKIQTI